jgi:putative hydrolase of the HAD superfamily
MPVGALLGCGVTLRAMVFDLDGTLFDHPSAALSGLRTWPASLGRASTAELETAWFEAEERHFRSWRGGEIAFAEQRRRRLRDVLPLLDLPVGSDAELDAPFADVFLAAYQAAWAGLRAVHLDRPGTGSVDDAARIATLHDLTDYLTAT